MTHGEETGPETHQDSAVLTYLEGLLMHRVAGAQSATATQRSEADKGNEEQRNKETPGLTLPKCSAQHEQDKTTPQGGSTHHVKKARLLRSEVWTERESQVRKISVASPELDGRKQEHCGGLNGSLQCKGESTLLASLLQNFSTRLQNVALSSQQGVQNLTPQKASGSGSNPNKEDKKPEHGLVSDETGQCLTGDSTVQTSPSSQMYHNREPSQERLSKSPGALYRSARSSSSESLHCTERLKAVASLVNIRSSPAPSPKPSVACSQLALLLSSEAHLQQYSREHALKTQLAGRSASERLAAIATQQTQEMKPPISQINHDGLSSLPTKNGIPSQTTTSSSRQSQSLHLGKSRSLGSGRRTHPFRERRPFERHGRASQNCSSLLLQLLNSHNTPQGLISQDQVKEDMNIFSSRGSPMFSDSEHSNSNSLPKDSSDAESTCSSCSPIDLSLKNKANISMPLSSSSSPALDKVTESLKNRWTSKSPTSKFPTEPKELHTCSEIKPHHKVTLLELLLDQKHMEKQNKAHDNPDLQPKIQPKVSIASTSNHNIFHPAQCKDTTESNPNCRMNTGSPKLLPAFSQGRDCNIRASPYSMYNSPHTQSVPLDLCKNKPLVSGPSVKEGAFIASKLLQNLAQCGKQNAASSPTPKAPLPLVKRQTEEFRTSKSSSLLEKLAVPVQKNNTTHVKSLVTESTQHNSEIENLLERRTVLQLLLGNKSQKEKVGKKRKGESAKQEIHSNSQNALNRPQNDFAVKAEPVEDEMFDDEKVANHWQNKLAETHRQSPHTPNQESIKQEPLSPMIVPRDGLLCHLLHQKPRNLKPNFLEHSNQECIKEEPLEHHQGPTIPKKRKFPVKPENHANVNSQQRMSSSSGSQKEDSDCSTSGIPESRESSDPSSPPQADSPPAKFPPCESPRNENGGFNVLKQLLLSDNCLKELSQSRGTFSSLERPVQNGRTIKEPSNNGELEGLHQTLNQGKPPSATAGVKRVQSLSDVQQDSSRSKRDFVPRRDLKPSTGFVNGDKTHDCHLDSPRLTKANPILYYMLQRSNAHLVRDRVELEAKSGSCRAETKEKDESEAFDLKVHLQQNQHHNGAHSCDTPRINGSLKKS